MTGISLAQQSGRQLPPVGAVFVFLAALIGVNGIAKAGPCAKNCAVQLRGMSRHGRYHAWVRTEGNVNYSSVRPSAGPAIFELVFGFPGPTREPWSPRDVEFLICGSDQGECKRWPLVRNGDRFLKDAVQNLDLIEKELRVAKIEPLRANVPLARAEQGGIIIPGRVMAVLGVDAAVVLRTSESQQSRHCVLEASAKGYGKAAVAELVALSADDGAWYCRKEFRMDVAHLASDNSSVVLGLRGFCDSFSSYTLELRAVAAGLKKAQRVRSFESIGKP